MANHMRKIRPEYFDLLGVLYFPFIFFCALYMFLTGQVLPVAILVFLLLTSVIGFIIDGRIVYYFFLRKSRK